MQIAVDKKASKKTQELLNYPVDKRKSYFQIVE